MKKNTTLLLILALCAAVLLFVLVIFLHSGPEDAPADDLTRAEDGTIILTPYADEETPAPEMEPAGEAAADAEEATEAPSSAGSAAVPEQEKPAKAAYFADAAFVGNETVMALKRYDYDGLLTEASFYEVESVTDTSYVNRIRRDGGCGKLYIGLGAYEMQNRVGDLEDELRSAITEVKTEYPGCIIYIMSVTPVSKYRESVNRNLRMDRLPEYNEMVSALAAELGVWYLEVTSVLVDEEGYLPSEVTEDGMNFTPAHYAAWYERIATHYIEDGKKK